MVHDRRSNTILRSTHMSSVFSGTFSGKFISDGTPKFIETPTSFDSIEVFNKTVSYAAGANTGAEFRFDKGSDIQGRGTIYTKTTSTNALQVGQIAANDGFFIQNTTINVPGAPVALTAISTANPPVVSTANTAGLIANSSIVRLYNVTGAQQLGGIDFTVGTIVANTSFTLAYMGAIAAATTGTYRIIPFMPYMYPSTRFITKISQATQAIVTLSVTHDYVIGQKVTFVIPTASATAFGMIELNNITATIVAINQADADGVTNTITVDADTTSFTAFAFPTTANYQNQFAQVVPAGTNQAVALAEGVYPYAGAYRNNGKLGILLMAGANSPAGVAGNEISWTVSKSFNT